MMKKDKKIWKIPLVIKLSNDELITYLFDKKSSTITFKDEQKWVKLNYGERGFYRVKYSEENLSKLQELILEKRLPPIDRWGIQNDLFGLTRIGEAYLDEYLDFIKAYKNEDDYFVLRDIYSKISLIYEIFSYERNLTKALQKLKEHLKEPYVTNLKRLGLNPRENENDFDALSRILSISYLSFCEDPEIIDFGLRKFSEYLKNPESLHPDLMDVVFSIAASNGNKNTYEKMIERYLSSQHQEEKVRLLKSIGKFKDKEILKEALDFSISGKVRLQDIGYIVYSVSSNIYGKNLILPWFKENWDNLKKYTNTPFLFRTLLECLITAHVGIDKEKEIRELIGKYEELYKRTVAKSFEIMRINTYWLERNKDILLAYFENK
jgi:aminopeptidase N